MFNKTQLINFLYLDKVSNGKEKLKEVPKYAKEILVDKPRKTLIELSTYLGEKISPDTERAIGIGTAMTSPVTLFALGVPYGSIGLIAMFSQLELSFLVAYHWRQRIEKSLSVNQ